MKEHQYTVAVLFFPQLLRQSWNFRTPNNFETLEFVQRRDYVPFPYLHDKADLVEIVPLTEKQQHKKSSPSFLMSSYKNISKHEKKM